MQESAILKTGHAPTSIKSVTEPSLILSIIFPKAPLSCREIDISKIIEPFATNIKKYIICN